MTLLVERTHTQHLERLSEAKRLAIEVHKPLVGLGSFLTHGGGGTCRVKAMNRIRWMSVSDDQQFVTISTSPKITESCCETLESQCPLASGNLASHVPNLS